MRRLRLWLPLLLAFMLVMAACGDDDDAETTTTAAETTTTAAETTTTAAETTTTAAETTTTAAETTTTMAEVPEDYCVTSDPNVRQALAALIDRDEISDVVFGGAAPPLYSQVPPGFLGASEAFDEIYAAPNPELADELLRASGYSEDNPLMLDFAWPPEHYGVTTNDASLLIVDQWEASGLIDVNPIIQEWSTYIGAVVGGQTWPVSVLGWFFDFPDAENYLQPFIENGGTGTQVTDRDGNLAPSVNPQIIELMQAQRAATDTAERAAILEELQTVYAEEVVTIPLFTEPEYVVYRDGISGNPDLPLPEKLNIGATMEFGYANLRGGDTIIIGTTDTVSSLDAADAYAVRDWEVLRNIGSGLVGWVPGTADQLEPVLAEDFATISDDGLTYTYTLREGIQFGDGLELTNEMYAAQLNRLFTLSPDGPNAVGLTLTSPYVATIEASGERDIVFTLTQPLAFFPQLLASAAYLPTHPDIFTQEELNLFPDVPIYGVGPWTVTEFVPQEQMVFEPNPNYFGDTEGQPSQIIVRHFQTPQAMADAVRTGEIDIAWRILGIELAEQIREEGELNVEIVSETSIRYLIVNHAETCGGEVAEEG